MHKYILNLLLLLTSYNCFAGGVGMPAADNLQAVYANKGSNNQGDNKVVLLLVSQQNCSYCVQITEEILKPMLIGGHYEQTTLFAEVEINSGKQLSDFTGKKVTADKFAQRYNAWATPTLLFLNENGDEVAKKMVGINTLDLYGFYVDKALRTGFQKINSH